MCDRGARLRRRMQINLGDARRQLPQLLEQARLVHRAGMADTVQPVIAEYAGVLQAALHELEPALDRIAAEAAKPAQPTRACRRLVRQAHRLQPKLASDPQHQTEYGRMRMKMVVGIDV